MNLVTGATGLLGSHIVEQLLEANQPVTCLVRPTSRTDWLRRLGVKLVVGDLTGADALHRALRGVEVAYHAAARVGDWGDWHDFERDCIRATHNLLRAAHRAGVARLIYISSTSAYGHPEKDEPITEDHPLGRQFWVWDYYTRAKVLTEQLVWDFYHKTGLPITVIRPSWLYGPRDRTSIFRLVRSLRSGSAMLVGDGNNRLNCVYAGSVARACILASRNPRACGQAYNVTNDGEITQRQFFELFARELGCDPPRMTVPYPLAFTAAFVLEAAYRMVRASYPPFVTRYAVWLLGRNTCYSTTKAESQLGWRPVVTYEEGIRRTVQWYLQISQNNGERV
ncbi:MAG: epimerase [Gemmataceae bacterium]